MGTGSISVSEAAFLTIAGEISSSSGKSIGISAGMGDWQTDLVGDVAFSSVLCSVSADLSLLLTTKDARLVKIFAKSSS
jgi:hypothetical protein